MKYHFLMASLRCPCVVRKGAGRTSLCFYHFFFLHLYQSVIFFGIRIALVENINQMRSIIVCLNADLNQSQLTLKVTDCTMRSLCHAGQNRRATSRPEDRMNLSDSMFVK